MVENLDCVTSKPCYDVYEETHPDWAPTIFKFMSHSATNVSCYTLSTAYHYLCCFQFLNSAKIFLSSVFLFQGSSAD
ncbi:hypothetical protein OUZ56_017496 [Daphnia magna]|uniref:Uncharacterized protein n=1 Tax=Daphnia magna TaxID=35525 RepID=A0ABR0ASW8_9CRUS|nr:hypothetical protein OUZ56_017496 [Daphnia magna]